MAKKDSGRPATKYVTRCFTTKKTRRCSYTVALPSEQQQVPLKIEGVRLRKSRWIAEIKHPNKKYVRIWLGSYATPEEASQVYQSKKMEHEKIKLQPDDRAVDFDDQETVNVLEESKAESLFDDRDVDVNVVEFDDRAMKVVDYQAEKSLMSRGKVVEEEFGDMLQQLGTVLIDRYGYILGEFGWIDDLSITS